MSLIASDSVVLSLEGEAAPRTLAGLTRHALHLTRPLTERSGAGPWAGRASHQHCASAELRAEGVFVSGEAQAVIRDAFLEGEPRAFSLDLPGEGSWAASFLVRQLTMKAEAEGEVAFSLRLSSSGEVRFLPEKTGADQ
jgi:predicted secreted protein